MAIPLSKKRWTLDEVHALPDDGNKYELIDGELFVSPPPTNGHETIGARLDLILGPYVVQHRLGIILRPRAVFRVERRIEVEPDLMVRPEYDHTRNLWELAPRPILVVEVVSPSSRTFDRVTKRDVYLSNGIPEYWIIDAAARSVTVIRSGQEDEIAMETVTWRPAAAMEPFTFPVSKLFDPWR